METDIKLGDEVKCKYTGVKGVVLSRTDFINGCIQFGVVPKWNKALPLEQASVEVAIDSQSLIIIKKGEMHEEEDEDEVGGAMRVIRRR